VHHVLGDRLVVGQVLRLLKRVDGMPVADLVRRPVRHAGAFAQRPQLHVELGAAVGMAGRGQVDACAVPQQGRIPQAGERRDRAEVAVPPLRDFEQVRDVEQMGRSRLAPLRVHAQRGPLLDRAPLEVHAVDAQRHERADAHARGEEHGDAGADALLGQFRGRRRHHGPDVVQRVDVALGWDIVPRPAHRLQRGDPGRRDGPIAFLPTEPGEEMARGATDLGHVLMAQRLAGAVVARRQQVARQRGPNARSLRKAPLVRPLQEMPQMHPLVGQRLRLELLHLGEVGQVALGQAEVLTTDHGAPSRARPWSRIPGTCRSPPPGIGS